MAGSKAPLLLGLLFMVSGAAAVNFDISVNPDPRISFYDEKFNEDVADLQNYNLSASNSGSVGCSYRLKAVIQGHRRNSFRYSREAELWPGENRRMKVYHVPDRRGRINGTVKMLYCGLEEKVANISFNVTELPSYRRNFSSRTLRSGERSALVDFSFEEALLVPVDIPVQWEVPHSIVNSSRATLEYDPPIFDQDRNITYAVVNRSSGEVLGKTRVQLEPDPTFFYRFKQNLWKIALAISLLLNYALILKLFKLRK